MPASTPHSWGVTSWPEAIWPHTPERARWLIRAHRNSLLNAGCLSRVGRELVVIGSRYERWLMRQANNVQGYVFPGSRPST
jgi:hypothetical protein